MVVATNGLLYSKRAGTDSTTVTEQHFAVAIRSVLLRLCIQRRSFATPSIGIICLYLLSLSALS